MVSHYSPGWPQVFFFNIVCVFVHIEKLLEFSSSTVCVLGIRYSSSGLVASILTCRVFSPALRFPSWKSHLLGLLIVPFLLFLLSLRSLLLYVVVSVLNPVLLLFVFWLHLVVVIIKWIQILLALISFLNSLTYTRIYQALLPQFQSQLICLPSTASKIYSFSVSDRVSKSEICHPPWYQIQLITKEIDSVS